MKRKSNPVCGAMVVGEIRISGTREHPARFFIPLSTIITINIKDEEKCEPDDNSEYEPECVFETEEGCSYVAQMTAFELQEAINSFIFNPDEHMKKYPPML